MSAMSMLNVKVDDETRALIERAVAVSEATNRSEWIREALIAGAQRELTEHARALQRMTLGMRVEPPVCRHPPTAIWTGIVEDVCTLCGTVVRSRL